MLINRIFLFVSAVIRSESGKILFLRRSEKNKHYKHYWQLPEGKLEPDETPVDAITRELREEINHKVENLRLKSILAIKIKEKGISFLQIKAVFVTQGKPRIKLSSHHLEYGWFSPEEAEKKLKLVPGTKEVLEKL